MIRVVGGEFGDVVRLLTHGVSIPHQLEQVLNGVRVRLAIEQRTLHTTLPHLGSHPAQTIKAERNTAYH